MIDKKIEPIRVTTKDGEVFTLEFSRDTVIWINNHGFVREDFVNKLEEMLPILWFGAFRMHHKNVAREKTDKILEATGGLNVKQLERLIDLYNAPRTSLIRDDDDDDEEPAKNCEATVEI